jgi:acyl-CoA thioesterase FadM
VQVFVDRETRKPIPVPDAVRHAFEEAVGALSGTG